MLLKLALIIGMKYKTKGEEEIENLFFRASVGPTLTFAVSPGYYTDEGFSEQALSIACFQMLSCPLFQSKSSLGLFLLN